VVALGQAPEVVVNNFDPATSRVRERAGVERSFDLVETIGREDRACDPARTVAASNGNRAMAFVPIALTVFAPIVQMVDPTVPIVDPAIAGPI
jgi:hypothetical protein